MNGFRVLLAKTVDDLLLGFELDLSIMELASGTDLILKLLDTGLHLLVL